MNNPHHPGTRFKSACSFMQASNWHAAIETWLDLHQDYPYHFETLVNLAHCYLETKAVDKAQHYYLLAKDITPNDIQVLFNLGVIAAQQGQLNQAMHYYYAMLSINPFAVEAHHNLAVIYLQLHQQAEAIEHFSFVLQQQPENAHVRYILESLTQHSSATAKQAPLEYVRTLFDSYAAHYDAHMQKALDCQVPKVLFDAVRKAHKQNSPYSAILDLGCGTGACGSYFRPHTKTLIGVDISEKMLALANEKNIYDKLYCQSITDFLRQTVAQYDVILAGDVLVYFGDLSELFALIKPRLSLGGVFGFTVEKAETGDWERQKTGRFGHSEGYLNQLTSLHGFKFLILKETSLRKQISELSKGYVAVLTNT